MVLPPNYQQLQDSNIDTIERAIVYGATLLKAAYTKAEATNKINEKIRITHRVGNADTYDLVIEATLEFNNITALESGGNIINNLFATNNLPLPDINYSCPASVPATPMLPIITSEKLKSLEHFFFYYCCLLKASLPAADRSIAISYLEDNSVGGKTTIQLALPLNYTNWLLGSNYVACVTRKVTSYINLDNFIDIFEPRSLALSNSADVNNLVAVGN